MGRRALNERAPWPVLIAGIVAFLMVFLALLPGLGSRAEADAERELHVVGGTAVADGKYPFVAALYDTRLGSTPYEQQFCGGTLIDGDSVLTAAHCVAGEPAGELWVSVGRTVLNSDQGQARRVARVFVHSGYRGCAGSCAYDVAVLKLSRPVTDIEPVKLATAGQNGLERPGRSATGAGWGNTIAQPPSGGNGSSFPNRMREVRVPIVTDSYARRAYGTRFVPALHVPAGKTGKDVCQGDSGGPFFTKAGGSFTQIGLTSWGFGCGARGYPNIYTEVNAPPVKNFISKASKK